MKPLSFEEWYEKEAANKFYYYAEIGDMIGYVEQYAQYRAKLAWDEAAKAQRNVCISQISKSNYTFSPTNGIYEAIKNAPLVEYKETL